MLTVDTKRKINSLRDILVGKVPNPTDQVDQITNALIYKYMDDMDQDAIALGGKASFFVGEYEKYAWRNLMDTRNDAQIRMNLYVEALERMGNNKKLSPIFRDILKEAYLPYRSPETLDMFLHEIDGFHYDHSEELGNAFEYLLSIMGSQGDAGQFRTPRHIIDFMVEIIAPTKDEKILDPACGTAGFLISAYNFIKQNHDGVDNKTGKKTEKEKPLTNNDLKKIHKNFTGYDISPSMAKLSRVNMFLHQFPDPQIFEYDTLSSDDRWDEHFDVIIANPPFMTPRGGIQPHRRFSVNANRAEVLFVDYIMNHLTKSGRAGIIVPEGIVFKGETAYKQLRKNLIEDGLYAVVSLPSGVFQPYSGVKTSILLFDNQLSKKTDEILFVKISNDGFNLGAQRTLIEGSELPDTVEILWKHRDAILNNKSGGQLLEGIHTARLVKKDKVAENGDYNLSGDRYIEEQDYTNAKWPIVELGDVCEILDRMRRPITKSDRKSGEYPYYGATGILDYVKDFIFDEKLVLIGEDGAKWGVGDKTAFIAYGKYWVNNHAHVIRPDRTKILDELLVELVNNMDLMPYITGVTVPKLNQEKLRAIKIPLPPLEVQKKIVAEIGGYQKIINGAKQVVENWKPKIDIDPEWKKIKLGDVFEIESGGTPDSSNKDYWNGDVKWATLVDIPNTVDIIYDTQRKISAEGLRNSSAKLLPKGTVLISSRATIGRIAIAGCDIATNQGFKNIIVGEDNDPYFIAYSLSEKVEQMIMMATGGTFKEISKSNISRIEVLLPPLDLQKEIVEKIEVERKIVESNKKLIDIYEKKIKDVIAKLWNE